MAEEIKPIITIDIGDSQKSVKQLKDEISKLRDYILNLQKGTDEYDKAVKQLAQDQRQLDEVMALTKKTATALDGSYDALTHKMALLKKEWKATNDEARRSELAQQIADINTQLKEFDAEIGNFQRRVGEYTSHWEGMEEATKDFATEMRNAMEAVEPTKQKFESVGKIAAGLASGFAAVKGAAALLGVENKDLEKTFVQLQAAIALAQGIGGMVGLVEGVAKAKVAFKGLGDTIKAVSKTMGVTGWVGVIVAAVAAITALVMWLKNSNNSAKELEETLEKVSEKNKKLAQSVAAPLSQYTLLQKQFKELNSESEKAKWIKENTEAFDQLGLSVKNLNDAQDIFINKSEDVINAIRLQAEAAAMSSIYQEKYAEAYAKKRDLEAKKALIKEGYKPTDEEETGAGLGITDYQTSTQVISSNYGAAMTASVPTQFVNSAGVEKVRRFIDTQIASIDEELGTVLNDLVTLQSTASDAANKVSNLFKSTTANSQVNIDTLFNTKVQGGNTKINTNVNWGEYEKGGEFAKTSAVYVKNIEETYALLRRENEIYTKDEQLKFEERNRLILEAESKKLEILKQYREEAFNNSDIDSLLLLDKQIAEQEIAIVEEKNRQILESEEKTKEKREKLISGISTALQSAGSVTQGILEITQAAAEADGKITEEEAKKIKGIQYATATINMLQGAITAFSSAQQLGPILGPIIGGANAAAVIAMGTANLMKIKNTDLTGSISGGAMGAVTPNSNVYGTNIPISYTRNVMTDSETETLNQPIKAYVVESEITDVQNKNKNRTLNSEF